MSGDPASSASTPGNSVGDNPGCAGRGEIVPALNELLEAERAGARVALASARSQSDPNLRELMLAVRADEARWCAMLSRQIRRCGGTPSPKIGSFYAKAMAIPNSLDRLAFLNRGQGWVVRKLESLTAGLRDHVLQADLQEMLDSHRANIARASVILAAKAGHVQEPADRGSRDSEAR